MTYTFPQRQLLSVSDHADSLDIVILSLSLSGGVYTMQTNMPFPDNQVDHLEMTVV